MGDASAISLRGVRVHNLRGIDVDIPLGKLTVVTGVSGAGKSSLVFDALYAEAQRRYLQSFSTYTRQFLERFDQPDAEFIGPMPPAVAVRARSLSHQPRATVGTLTEVVSYLRLLVARFGVLHCVSCGAVVRAQQPDDVLRFSAALPAGTRLTVAFPSMPSDGEDLAAWAARLREEGFVRLQIGTQLIRLDGDETLALPIGHSAWVLVDRLEAGKAAPARLRDSIETAFQRGGGRLAILTDQAEQVFERRLVCTRCNIAYPEPSADMLDFNHPLGACPACQGTGLVGKGKTSLSVGAPQDACADCAGTRLQPQARALRWQGVSIVDLAESTVAELRQRLSAAAGDGGAAVLLEEVNKRLEVLDAVAMGYLTLDRRTSTLSTTEARRLLLTKALASPLVSALYLLEEPLAGAHRDEVARLWAQVLRLRAAGNTVVVIENNLAALAGADHVIDLGPGAGEEGGALNYQGVPGGLTDTERSLTAAFLQDDADAPPTKRRTADSPRLRLRGARLHNLQDLTVEFPLGVLCVVTGVSGAGKSTLVEDTLYPALCQAKHKKHCPPPPGVELAGAGSIEDVVLMDQAPLSRTARSNPATYLKVYDDIRDLFAATTEAKIRNLGPGAFSFNQAGGRCETCAGQGTLEVDMQFLADVVMTCPECQGTRFKKDILNVKVRSLNVAEVLNLTVRAAFRFFRAQATIERRLKVLLDVGLDYLRLGQPLETLSAGEGQRLKLAAHLSSSRRSRCLFILVEPTIGLHPADIENLLACFNRLLDTGHSLIVVENNEQVLRHADHIIELGPGAGSDGGRVVGERV